jgi:hypothetical protein
MTAWAEKPAHPTLSLAAFIEPFFNLFVRQHAAGLELNHVETFEIDL